ncbi:MAG: endolytic transglycosylase MltG [Aquificae bacterium]|nr:endolytic transglycosylase MltG [Aquificota bacterium]
MKKLIPLIILLVASLLYLAYAFMPVYVETKTVDIPYGTSALKVIETLHKEGIIRSKLSLIIIHALRKDKLEAGEYEFSGHVSPFDVYRKLSRGIHKLHRVVITEGSDIYDIADILEKKGVCKKEDFLKFATSEQVPRGYGLSTPTMEGFLFPDTYLFSKNTHPLKVIDTMYRNFLKKTVDLRPQVAKKGLSIEEWVTIASMIEKETAWEDEKPLVSAVIYNRLKRKMKLQIDPTVIYALKRKGMWEGKLTREHLKIDDPYNTYLYFGLPPTPICNPGLSSLKAALQPADVSYLYFVADPKTRRHIFSSTYSQHRQNIAKVRRRK